LKKWQRSYEIARASESAYEADAKKAQHEAALRVKEAQDATALVQGKLDSLEKESEQLRKDLLDQSKKGTQTDAVVTAGQREIERRQVDSENLREALKAQNAQNAQLVLDTNKMREEKVAAELAKRSVMDRAGQLEAQVQELTKELVRLRAGGAAVAGRTP